MNWNPVRPVLEQCLRTPDRLALFADGIELSYADLGGRAARLAAALGAQGIGRGSRVGILASRSLIAIEAVLGVAWCGATYVPLGLRWPDERICTVASLTGLDAMIADRSGCTLLTANMLAGIRVLVVPEEASADLPPDLANRVVMRFAERNGIVSPPGTASLPEPAEMSADDLVYVIFTSGTTGVPKGVMVASASLAAYLAALGARKAMTPDDRASQFTELSFDPSVGEIFVPLCAGASLHVVPSLSTVSPARFIRERQLTIWGSAPAAIAWLRDTRSLQPGSLPLLRYSSFGGEPLPLASVRAWQAAAPNSVVDNLYGPTEATVDCAGQLVAPGATPVVTPERGVLAIGTPHPGSELAVFGPDRRPLPTGAVGELGIAGSQLAVGYFEAPGLTDERYPVIDGKRWFLTGDLAMRDDSGLYHHMGRRDNQIKIHGHRVELEEIEAHLRAVTQTDQVAAVAWPMEAGVALAIVGFVGPSGVPANQIRAALRKRLPPHMVPSAIHELAALPLNTTGKVDRRALIDRLQAGRPESGAIRG
jgi:amino acid adenylation domain-containing protein